MFVATNTTDAEVVFRDDAGKHFVKPGSVLVLVGDQHAPAAEAAGLDVQWTLVAPDTEAVVPDEPADEEAPAPPAKPRRRARVTVRED